MLVVVVVSDDVSPGQLILRVSTWLLIKLKWYENWELVVDEKDDNSVVFWNEVVLIIASA